MTHSQAANLTRNLYRYRLSKRRKREQDYSETVTDEPSRALQENEKTKGWSTVLTNLGTGLVATAAGRLWVVGLDVWVVVWSVLGYSLVRFGIHMLNDLEAEN